MGMLSSSKGAFKVVLRQNNQSLCKTNPFLEECIKRQRDRINVTLVRCLSEIYLEKEKITYDLYEKKEENKLEQAYQEAYSDKSRERECQIWDILETESWDD